jgi:hypothetical protein
MRTRRPATDSNYRSRARQNERAAARTADRELSPVEVAEWLIARNDLTGNSFRQMRSSLRETWKEDKKLFPDHEVQYNTAIKLLEEGKRPQSAQTKELRTSQCKQKGIDPEDLKRICHATRAGRSPNALELISCLHAGMLTGARFVEWPTAKFGPSQVAGFAHELIFENGKQGNGRSHGSTRTLRWESLHPKLVSALNAWINISAQAKSEGKYETLYETLSDLMRRVTKELFRGGNADRPCHPRGTRLPRAGSTSTLTKLKRRRKKTMAVPSSQR